MERQFQVDGFPVYINGDRSILDYVPLYIENTLLLPKPYTISLPLKIQQKQSQSIVEPIIKLQILSEIQRQNLTKNRNLIKQNIFYIYFPASIRVDQKIYRIYNNNYQNLIKEAPRSYRNNFSKFIIWEDGKGQHSIAWHKAKLLENLSMIAKIQIQKKIQQITLEIKQLQSTKLTPKILQKIFLLKNQLARIFKYLKLRTISNEILENIWKQLLLQRSILTTQPIEGYKIPYIQQNIIKIIQLFESPQKYLTIVSYSFIYLYRNLIQAMLSLQALIKLRYFIDYAFTHILKNINNLLPQIKRYLWAIQIINFCIDNQSMSILSYSQQSNNQYYKLQASLWSSYRRAIQKIGLLVYGIDNRIIFPTTIQKQLKFIIQTIVNPKQPQQTISKIQLKQIILVQSSNISTILNLIIDKFSSFIRTYVKILQSMYKILIITPFKKTSESLYLTLMKAYVYYINELQPQKIQQLKIQKLNYIWPSLQILQKIFNIYFYKKQKNNQLFINQVISLLKQSIISQNQSLWISLSNLLKIYQQQHQFTINQINSINIQNIQNYFYKAIIDITDNNIQLFPINNCSLTIQQNQQQQLKQIQLSNIKILKNVITCQLNISSLLIFKIIKLNIYCNNLRFSISNKQINKQYLLNTISIKKSLNNLNIYQSLYTPISIEIQNWNANYIDQLNIKTSLDLKQDISCICDGFNQTISLKKIKQLKFTNNSFITIIFYVCPIQKSLISSSLSYDITISQNNKKYTLGHEYLYLIQKPFEISYFYIQQLEEYTINNIINLPIIVNICQDQEKYQIKPNQYLKINTNIIKMSLQNSLSSQLNLEKFIYESNLKPLNIEYFELQVLSNITNNPKNKYPIFQKISIKSQQIGKLKVYDMSEGYEIVGKVQGFIEYSNKQQKIINLWIIPLKIGKIVLPQLWINNKKGIWKNYFYIDIQ